MHSAPTLAHQLQKASKLPLVKLAPMLGVSRQTYHKWLRGRTMTPEHERDVKLLLQKYHAVVSYTIKSIAFECYRCGQSLTLNRRSLGTEASGLWCNGCHEHYWISWNSGELHNGTPDAAMAEVRGEA
jgi:hypothetical protein